MRNGLRLAVAICAAVLAAAARTGAEGGETGGPGAAVRGVTPKRVTLGSLSVLYEPVVFDHRKHEEEAGRCATCHHQHGTTETLSCRECHALDPAAFRKAVGAARFRPCRTCHPAAPRPGETAPLGLAAAYHRACISCHREVGSVGEDPKGCAEICHARKRHAANN